MIFERNKNTSRKCLENVGVNSLNWKMLKVRGEKFMFKRLNDKGKIGIFEDL